MGCKELNYVRLVSPLNWGLALLLGLVMVACGGDATAPGDVTDGGANGGTDEAAGRDVYPSAPYGTAPGSVLEDLSFLNPDGSDYSFAADLYADSGNRLMLLTTSSFWCTACIEEQPTLAELHDLYGDDGLIVVVTIFEDADFQPADESHAEQWVEQFGVPFTVVADPTFQFDPYYDRALTPMTMIVDVATMQIVSIDNGFDRTTVEATIRLLLDI